MIDHNWQYLEICSGKLKDLSQIKYKKKVRGHSVVLRKNQMFYNWRYLLDKDGCLWDGLGPVNHLYFKELPVMELQKTKNEKRLVTTERVEYTYWPGELLIECLVIPHNEPTYTSGKISGKIVGCQILNMDEYLDEMKKRHSIPDYSW